jgi:ATP-dependent DNA ligase
MSGSAVTLRAKVPILNKATFEAIASHAVMPGKFTEWTAEQRLRHAAFLGLRVDKAAKDVRREP